FHASASTELYTLSLHDALPIYVAFAYTYNVGDVHVFYLPSHLIVALLAAPALTFVRELVRPDRRAGADRRVRTDAFAGRDRRVRDRKSTRLNSSHRTISYAVFC